MPDITKDLQQILYSADSHCKRVLTEFNTALKPLSPIELIIVTLAAALILRYAIEKLQAWSKIGLKTLVFRIATKLPYVRGQIAEKEKKMSDEYLQQYGSQRKNAIRELPQKGMPLD